MLIDGNIQCNYVFLNQLEIQRRIYMIFFETAVTNSLKN